jgi:hypothetical protein
VDFRLSLLNEEGKTATTFREGENFSFRFEMENLRKNDKRQYKAHLMGGLFNSGFCRIYTTDGDFVYAAFQETAACAFVLRMNPFDGDNQLTVTHAIHYNNEEWHHGMCGYRRNPPVDLPKGDYYTGFTYTFEYSIPPENVETGSSTRVETGPVTMRINFTIE